MMDKEIELGVVRCNGENNAKELPKNKKGSWEYTYNSTGRNLVKMWWLSKFVAALLGDMVNSPTKEFSTCCKDAYKVGFGDNHSWLVRKGALLAMGFVGSRDSVKTALGVSSES